MIVIIDNQVIHYEAFGRGRPVLFLHGWLGSWRYWFPTMEAISKDFRTYSFDFWGFGDSRYKNTQESVQNYSQQVIRFLDALGIDQIMLVGHSMGGMVALKTAISYPDRVDRVVTVGAPIQGTSISSLLKLIDRPFFASLFARSSWLRRSLFHFFLGETTDPAVDEIIDDSVKSSANTMHYSISSLLRTDLRPELLRLRVPSLIIHGKRDDIVDPRQINLFGSVASAKVMLMPRSRHFPFLDEPEMFNEALIQFLKYGQTPPPVPPVTISEPKMIL